MSLRIHCAARAEEIHVQFTPAVSSDIFEAFQSEGYQTHRITLFGDAKWCNKLSQLANLFDERCDYFVLLDTDTVAVADLRTFVSGGCILGKTVDCANPSLNALRELYVRAGGTREPRLALAESEDSQTFFGNANGGFYAIPSGLARRFSEEWRRWAEWLFANDEPLRREGKLAHVDQISVAFAVQLSDVPFASVASNVNYFIHFRGRHRYRDPHHPIALLHYHTSSLSELGRIEPPFPLEVDEAAAVAEANRMFATVLCRSERLRYCR